MDWAREIRGMSSTAKLVILRSRRALTSAWRACACRNPTTTAPGFSCAICSRLSGATVRTTSACDRIAELPAHSPFLYSESGNWARVPAPDSSTTRAPAAVNLSTTSGTRLTRVSPGALSRSAPIVIGIWLGSPLLSEKGLWPRGQSPFFPVLNECVAALNSRTRLAYLTCLMLGIDLEKADHGLPDLQLVAGYSPRALSQLVLRTDVSGMPLEWIDYKEAARLYHQEQVAYTCGSPLFKLYGGVSARSGLRTVLEVNSIVATVGHTGNPGT